MSTDWSAIRRNCAAGVFRVLTSAPRSRERLVSVRCALRRTARRRAPRTGGPPAGVVSGGTPRRPTTQKARTSTAHRPGHVHELRRRVAPWWQSPTGRESSAAQVEVHASDHGRHDVRIGRHRRGRMQATQKGQMPSHGHDGHCVATWWATIVGRQNGSSGLGPIDLRGRGVSRERCQRAMCLAVSSSGKISDTV